MNPIFRFLNVLNVWPRRLCAIALVLTCFANVAHAKDWLQTQTLPGVKTLNATERAAWAKRISGQVAYNFADADGRVLMHDGDLVIDGNLDNGERFIVNGNLTIKGNYHDYLDGIGVLVVLGNMQVENVYSWGAISVRNDLNASGIVLTCYNDFTFEVAGNVNARALVISDKSADYHRGTIEVVLSDNVSDEDLAWRILRPEFFTGPNNLEPDAQDADWLLHFDDALGEKRVAAGGVFFRSEPGSKSLPDQVRRAMNPATTLSELKALIGLDPMLTQLIAARPNLPKALYPLLQAQADETANLWLARVAPNAVLGGQSTTTLTPELAESAVANPETDEAVLGHIAAHSAPAVRMQLARRNELPRALLEKLIADADASVRAAILGNVLLAMDLSAQNIAARMNDVPEVLNNLPNAKLDAKQMMTLLPKLTPAGLSTLATRLLAERFDGWPSALSALERDQVAIEMLTFDVKNNSVDFKSNAFLALTSAEQSKRLQALLQTKQIDPNEIASHTHSLALMQQLWQLAKAQSPDGRSQIGLGAELAENPLLPESIGLEMLEFAKNLPKPDANSFEPNHFDMLENLFGNDDLDHANGTGPLHSDLLVDTGITLALKHQLGLDDAFLQPLLSLSLSSAHIQRLDAAFGSNEDWALSKAFSARATRAQMHSGLARWYEEAEVQAELRALSKLPEAEYWEALAKAKAAELRQAAARRSELSTKTLQQLLKDQSDEVKHYVLRNPKLPAADALVFMTSMKDEELGYAKASLQQIDALLKVAKTRARRAALLRLRAQRNWVLE
jgi:hypothetical protein